MTKRRIDYDEVVRRYLAGEPVWMIASEMGISMTSVRYARGQAGVPARPTGRPKGKARPPRPRTVTGRAVISGNPADPRHGTVNGYCNLGCRCARCRAAWAKRTAAAQAKRQAKVTPDDPRHGTYSFYCNHVCRCDACRKAAAEYHRSRNTAKRTASTQQETAA